MDDVSDSNKTKAEFKVGDKVLVLDDKESVYYREGYVVDVVGELDWDGDYKVFLPDLPTQYIEAHKIRAATEEEIKNFSYRIVELNDSPDAIVSPFHVSIGFQKIPHDKILDLAGAIRELRSKS